MCYCNRTSDKYVSLSFCTHFGETLFILACVTLTLSLPFPPKGGRGCLMSLSCLESHGCHLIPLFYLLLFFYLLLLHFLSSLFLLLLLMALSLSLSLSPENSSIFFVKKWALLYVCCLAPRSELVGVCAACCLMALVFADMHLYNILICFCSFPYIYIFLIWC